MMFCELGGHPPSQMPWMNSGLEINWWKFAQIGVVVVVSLGRCFCLFLCKWHIWFGNITELGSQIISRNASKNSGSLNATLVTSKIRKVWFSCLGMAQPGTATREFFLRVIFFKPQKNWANDATQPSHWPEGKGKFPKKKMAGKDLGVWIWI